MTEIVVNEKFKTLILASINVPVTRNLGDPEIVIIDDKPLPSSERQSFRDKFEVFGCDGSNAFGLGLKETGSDENGKKKTVINPLIADELNKKVEALRVQENRAIDRELATKEEECTKVRERLKNLKLEEKKQLNRIDENKSYVNYWNEQTKEVEKEYKEVHEKMNLLKENFVLRFLIRLFSKGELE